MKWVIRYTDGGQRWRITMDGSAAQAAQLARLLPQGQLDWEDAEDAVTPAMVSALASMFQVKDELARIAEATK